MFPVLGISEYPYQTRKLTLPDGKRITLTQQFRPMQYGWFITELTYENFTLNGLRICVSPNLLHQYRNQIPFGLACFSKGNREPTLAEDFQSGNVQLYILDEAEVQAYTEFLSD